LAERKRDVEGRGPGAVGDQHVSRSAAHIGHAERVDVILASEVPKNEGYSPVGKIHGRLVDLDAHRGEVGFGEYALDVALHQAGLANREAAEHADLLLQHRRHGSSSKPIDNDTRRLAERAAAAAAEVSSATGSSCPAPRA